MLRGFSSHGRPGGRGARVFGAAFALLLAACALSAGAQPVRLSPAPTVTYADMADLVEASTTVALVEIRSQVPIEAARAPGLAPAHVRLYMEAQTLGLLYGRSGLGQQVTFLADVPAMANGKAPKLKKQRMLVFASPVAGRPDTLQLAAPDAFVPATPASEQLTRTVIAALAAPGAPPRVKGVRDVMSVAGNLAGESETQLFVETATGAPAALTVVRRPGMQPRWGVSWSEIVDEAARPPEPQTIAWYRLACFLPAQLPPRAYLQPDASARAQAAADYRLILQSLGPCSRLRAPRP